MSAFNSATIYLQSVGVVGPGLTGWPQARAVFKGDVDYVSAPIEKYKPAVLPPNERRRATSLVRLAFQAAEEALAGCQLPPESLAACFATSGGDTHIMDQICVALNQPERPVSPTRFHNSVHNAPAGYWGIATGSQQPSTTICAHDDSFVVALRETLGIVLCDQLPVLMNVYDIQPSQPLRGVRDLGDSFACAWVFSPQPTDNTVAALHLSMADSAAVETAVQNQNELETLRQQNPAARGLPLLQALAAGQNTSIVIPAHRQPPLEIRLECR